MAKGKIKEEAKGIPSRKVTGDPLSLKPGQLVDFLIQKHDARRAGTHQDIRLGTERTGLFSWATRKELPAPGGKVALFQQPLHTHAYKDFEGEIPIGEYGAGSVSKKEEGKLLITKVTPESLHFTMAHKRHPQRFVLVKPKAQEDKRWLLVNTTPTKPIPYEKIKYTNIHHDKAEEILKNLQPGTSVQEKIDGAASLTQLLGDRLEVLSYRTSKETKGPIPHTERIFRGAHTLTVPKNARGSIIRGEIYGIDQHGKSIPPQELGGILNSSVSRSIETQNERKINLKNMVFDIEQFGSNKIPKSVPYSERLELLGRVLEHLPKDKFHLPEMANTSEGALKLYRDIKTGKNPRTKEGIVIHPPEGKPKKIKLTEDNDVYITSIFPGSGKYTGHSAGGFGYSLGRGDKEVGKVGTGISDELRRDMASDPKAYIGRTAKIRAQEKLPSGAFRAPSLLSLHEDLPMAKSAAEGWATRVTRESHAMDLEPGVFKMTPAAMASSVLSSAKASSNLKSTPYRSAMSMLVFYQNRAGKKLSPERRAALEGAKEELRKMKTAAKRDWNKFEQKLQDPKFQRKTLARTKDSKLKAYVKNYGAYITSKDVLASVPSRTNPQKTYQIKRLAGGRIACGCKDWQYKGSVDGSKCNHIKQWENSNVA